MMIIDAAADATMLLFRASCHAATLYDAPALLPLLPCLRCYFFRYDARLIRAAFAMPRRCRHYAFDILCRCFRAMMMRRHGARSDAAVSPPPLAYAALPRREAVAPPPALLMLPRHSFAYAAMSLLLTPWRLLFTTRLLLFFLRCHATLPCRAPRCCYAAQRYTLLRYMPLCRCRCYARHFSTLPLRCRRCRRQAFTALLLMLLPFSLPRHTPYATAVIMPAALLDAAADVIAR